MEIVSVYHETPRTYIQFEDENKSESPSKLLTYELLLEASAQMTESEKSALSQWEKEFITGDDKYSTSDWNGWGKVLDRLMH